MAVYTVHVPNDGEDGFARASRTAFVRDGFSWPAFLFGPLYLLGHRAWIAAAAWVVGVLALATLNRLAGTPLGIEVALGLLVMLFTGLEAATLRCAALGGRGFDFVDVAEGRREDAERVFFRKATAAGLPARRTTAAGSVSTGTGSAASGGGGVIGFDDFGTGP